jgi:uncharacterized spore protein YtfJ
MEHIQEMLGAIGGQVGDVAASEAVIGSPIKLGPVTVYPISRISLGLGGGGGTGTDFANSPKSVHGPQSGTGRGAGGGAKARPVAVLVFSEEGISVLPIADKKGKLDQILEKIPGLIDEIKGRMAGEPCSTS